MAQAEERTINFRFARGLSQRRLAINARQHKTAEDFVHAQFGESLGYRVLASTVHGQKLLRCEELVGGPGISALLFFYYDGLSKLPIEELANAMEAIKADEQIMEICREFGVWLDR